MPKVCHMTSVHSPEDIRIFHKECVSLAAAGYEVTLIQQGGSYEKNGVKICGIGNLTGNRLQRMLQGMKRVYEEAVAEDAEIYHFHDPELMFCGLKLKRAGKHVVFDSHEKYSMQLRRKPYLPRFASELIAVVYSVFERYAIKKFDAVIFPCTLNGVHPFEGQCKRLITLNNLPMLEEIYNKWEPTEKKEFKACYVGGIRPDRGNTENVKACNLADVDLILAGRMHSDEYEAQLRALDVKKLTEFCGVLNREQVVDVLKRSSVGLVTELNVGQNNVFDNLPTKTYEYMSMGLPVIISHSNYVDQLLNEKAFGIVVDPENVEEIAQAIVFLRDNPEEAKRMGENGRRAVKEEFNWGVEEKKLFALYEDILHS